jgi:metal-responsive CopG/Arc/MetJ family transcriptional regulator
MVILRYNSLMKTAISIPDDVFESADSLAEKIGVSRSELYATAVAEYLAKFKDQDITQRLDQVYAEEASGLPPELRRAQATSIAGSEW